MTDTRIAALLDELTPAYDDRRGDWERIVADAAPQRRRFTSPRRARAAALIGLVAAAAALVLGWPFDGQHGNLLDRARAAIGDGPVLHVVLRGEWGGMLVDLSNGERRSIYGDTEVWFDTETNRTRWLQRLGESVESDEVGVPKKPAAELAALGREYREALESGTARISGADVIDGESVVWVTIRSELLPDVADGKDHEWAQQVAVSKRTFKAVALRETRDGQPGPGTLQRVLELQMIGRDAADFTASHPSLAGTAVKQGRQPIELEQAAAVLGRTPLWLGKAYDGLPLARVYREVMSLGHQRRVRVTGAKAAAAIKCSEQHASDAGDCFRALGLSAVEVAPDGVFIVEGPIEWRDEPDGVAFFYGAVGDDASPPGPAAPPRFDERYVTVSESLSGRRFQPGAANYVPPPGSVFITASGKTGLLQRDGIHISIAAESEDAVLAAARALTPWSQTLTPHRP